MLPVAKRGETLPLGLMVNLLVEECSLDDR
jgi:hypothetical protein